MESATTESALSAPADASAATAATAPTAGLSFSELRSGLLSSSGANAGIAYPLPSTFSTVLSSWESRPGGGEETRMTSVEVAALKEMRRGSRSPTPAGRNAMGGVEVGTVQGVFEGQLEGPKDASLMSGDAAGEQAKPAFGAYPNQASAADLSRMTSAELGLPRMTSAELGLPRMTSADLGLAKQGSLQSGDFGAVVSDFTLLAGGSFGLGSANLAALGSANLGVLGSGNLGGLLRGGSGVGGLFSGGSIQGNLSSPLLRAESYEFSFFGPLSGTVPDDPAVAGSAQQAGAAQGQQQPQSQQQHRTDGQQGQGQKGSRGDTPTGGSQTPRGPGQQAGAKDGTFGTNPAVAGSQQLGTWDSGAGLPSAGLTLAAERPGSPLLALGMRTATPPRVEDFAARAEGGAVRQNVQRAQLQAQQQQQQQQTPAIAVPQGAIDAEQIEKGFGVKGLSPRLGMPHLDNGSVIPLPSGVADGGIERADSGTIEAVVRPIKVADMGEKGAPLSPPATGPGAAANLQPGGAAAGAAAKPGTSPRRRSASPMVASAANEHSHWSGEPLSGLPVASRIAGGAVAVLERKSSPTPQLGAPRSPQADLLQQQQQKQLFQQKLQLQEQLKLQQEGKISPTSLAQLLQQQQHLLQQDQQAQVQPEPLGQLSPRQKQLLPLLQRHLQQPLSPSVLALLSQQQQAGPPPETEEQRRQQQLLMQQKQLLVALQQHQLKQQQQLQRSPLEAKPEHAADLLVSGAAGMGGQFLPGLMPGQVGPGSLAGLRSQADAQAGATGSVLAAMLAGGGAGGGAGAQSLLDTAAMAGRAPGGAAQEGALRVLLAHRAAAQQGVDAPRLGPSDLAALQLAALAGTPLASLLDSRAQQQQQQAHGGVLSQEPTHHDKLLKLFQQQQQQQMESSQGAAGLQPPQQKQHLGNWHGGVSPMRRSPSPAPVLSQQAQPQSLLEQQQQRMQQQQQQLGLKGGSAGLTASAASAMLNNLKGVGPTTSETSALGGSKRKTPERDMPASEVGQMGGQTFRQAVIAAALADAGDVKRQQGLLAGAISRPGMMASAAAGGSAAAAAAHALSGAAGMPQGGTSSSRDTGGVPAVQDKGESLNDDMMDEEDDEVDKVPGKPGPRRKKGPVTKPCAAARKRRDCISRHIRTLQGMIPSAPKSDAASILAETISFVSRLVQENEELKQALLKTGDGKSLAAGQNVVKAEAADVANGQQGEKRGGVNSSAKRELVDCSDPSGATHSGGQDGAVELTEGEGVDGVSGDQTDGSR